MEMKSEARVGEALGKLVSLFDGSAGDLPEAVALTMIRRSEAAGDRPSDRWSLSNRLLMLLSGTEDARGFQQWKRVGRSVRKGTGALWILAPITRPALVEDRDAPGEKVPAPFVVGFKAVPVFRVEDTEGAEIPGPDHKPHVFPPLYHVAADLGVRVDYAPTSHGEGGSYTLGGTEPGDRITVCTHEERVFFHEIAHAAHDRITPGGLKGGQHPRQEIVAETTAATLCLMYGFEGSVPNSKSYVEAYLSHQKSAAHAVIGVVAEVERVLLYILEPTRRPELDARARATSPKPHKTAA